MIHLASVRERLYGEPRRRYQAFCRCGWFGRLRTIRHAAVMDAEAHDAAENREP